MRGCELVRFAAHSRPKALSKLQTLPNSRARGTQRLVGTAELFFFGCRDGTYAKLHAHVTPKQQHSSVINPPGVLEQMAALASRAARCIRRVSFGLSMCVAEAKKQKNAVSCAE